MVYQGSTISVQVPEPIFRRLQRIAEATYRPIEDVLATTISVALPHSPDLPSDLDADLSAMTMFSDDALKSAAESSLSPSERRRLNQLSHAGGQRPLSAAESAELAHLVDLHDRAVLRRARALAILAHRGFAVADQDSSLESHGARQAKIEHAAVLYGRGELSLERAALMAGVSIYDMMAHVRVHGILPPGDLGELQSDVASMLARRGHDELAQQVLRAEQITD